MFKTIRLFIYIFLFQFSLTVMTNLIYRNRIFFIHSILITIVLHFFIGVVFIFILQRFYKEKANNQLKEFKASNGLKIKSRYDKLKFVFAITYTLLLIIPISLSIYIEKAPKYIYNLKDFDSIQNNPDGTYILKSDLDFSNKKPSNKYYDWCNEGVRFEGTLNGNGHVISNVSDSLFFCTSKTTVIKDVTIKEVQLNGRYADYTGVITNINNGLIENVHIDGEVSGYAHTGGLAGRNYGNINFSSFAGSVEGLTHVGGLVGYNQGSITNSYTSVLIKGKNEVGGLIGRHSGFGAAKIENVYSVGTVEGETQVGGLIGISLAGRITNAYTNSQVHGDRGVGGLIGHTMSYNVNRSFVLGSTEGNQDVGGLSGADGEGGRKDFTFVYGNVSGSDRVFGISPSYFNSYHYINQKVNEDVITSNDVVTKDELQNISWYKETLELDETVWDFEPVDRGYFPQLRELKNQEYVEIK